MSSWKGKYTPEGGRLVLINYVLLSLAMFMLPFLFLKGSLKKLDPTFIGKELNIKMV
jgi:hypothetical protein